MAALLIALVVLLVMASVALPVYQQSAQREKESELIFRGEQYARAIGLFQRKTGPGALPRPPGRGRSRGPPAPPATTSCTA